MDFIDKQTFKTLKIKPVLDMIKTSSELGRVFRKRLKPYTAGDGEGIPEAYNKLKRNASARSNQSRDALNTDYDKLKRFVAAAAKDESFLILLQSYLEKLKDISGLVKSLNAGRSALEVDELYEIRYFVFYYERIRSFLDKHSPETLSLTALKDIAMVMDPDNFDSPVFNIGTGFSQDLNRLRKKRLEILKRIKSIEESILAEAEQELDIKPLEDKVVLSRSNRRLVEKLNSSRHYYQSDENFANITFSVGLTPEMIEMKQTSEELRRKIEQEELHIRSELTEYISARKDKLLDCLEKMGELDFLTAKTAFCLENNCVIPVIIDSSGSEKVLSIKKGVNLSVKNSLSSEGINYQPVDIVFNSRINVLTGANMSGKSTVLDTIGQFIYLTAFAVPLPCEAAQISLVDYIYCNRLSSDETSEHRDLSSFAAEIVSLNNALKRPQGRGLFLLDELAKGTNPSEGTAFSAGVLEYLADSAGNHRQDIVAAATHFDIVRFVKKWGSLYRVGSISADSFEKVSSAFNNKANLVDRVRELHKFTDYRIHPLEPNENPPQAGIIIAEILGMRKEVLDRVKDKLPAEDNDETGCKETEK